MGLGNEYLEAKEFLQKNNLNVDINKPAKTKLSKLIKPEPPQPMFSSKTLATMKKIHKEKEAGNKKIGGLGTGLLLIAGSVLAIVAIFKTINRPATFSTSFKEPDTLDESIAHFKGNDDKTRVKNKIIDEATRQGVDPGLALAIAHQESGFNQKAKSKVGAIGVFQLMPDTAKGLGVDPYDETQNIQGGIRYIKQQLDTFKDVNKALAAYNAGPGNVRKYGGIPPFKETQNYIKNITALRQKYSKEVTKINTSTVQPQKNISSVPSTSIATKPTAVSNKSFNAKRFANQTKVGGYVMANPVAHGGKYYIELSEMAQQYLIQSGGSGLITSGSEGSHAPGEISHGSGNKIDVQGLRGAYTTNKEYARLCIPFIRNPQTAYINLESFSKQDIRETVDEIYRLAPELKNICEKNVKYIPGYKWATVYGYGKFLTSVATKYPRHLDIGIIPQKSKPKNKNTIKLTQPQQIKPTKTATQTKPAETDKISSTQNNQLINIKEPTKTYIASSLDANDLVKNTTNKKPY